MFDTSYATDNGVSVNDILLIERTIQRLIIKHFIVIYAIFHLMCSDSEKMYKMVRVNENC